MGCFSLNFIASFWRLKRGVFVSGFQVVLKANVSFIGLRRKKYGNRPSKNSLVLKKRKFRMAITSGEVSSHYDGFDEPKNRKRNVVSLGIVIISGKREGANTMAVLSYSS